MSLSFVIIIVVDNCQNHNKTGEKNVNIGEHWETRKNCQKSCKNCTFFLNWYCSAALRPRLQFRYICFEFYYLNLRDGVRKKTGKSLFFCQPPLGTPSLRYINWHFERTLFQNPLAAETMNSKSRKMDGGKSESSGDLANEENHLEVEVNIST